MSGLHQKNYYHYLRAVCDYRIRNKLDYHEIIDGIDLSRNRIREQLNYFRTRNEGRKMMEEYVEEDQISKVRTLLQDFNLLEMFLQNENYLRQFDNYDTDIQSAFAELLDVVEQMFAFKISEFGNN